MHLLPERSYSTLDYVHHCDALSLLRALADNSVDAIITDMPYGTTACSWDTVIDLAAWWVQVRRVLKPRGVMVTTGSQPFTSTLVMSNPTWFKYEWIWIKNTCSNFLQANYQPLKKHENILVFSDGNITFTPANYSIRYYPQWRGRQHDFNTGQGTDTSLRAWKERRGNDYQLMSNQNEGMFPVSYLMIDGELKTHPTQKPVTLYEYLIQTYTRPGELVLDPFSGSGTTAIAARKTGRHFICGDSSREYVEMSRQRLITTDPYQHRPLPDGRKQLSMFAGVMA